MSSSSLAELFGISSEDVANKKKGAKGKGSGKTAKKEKKTRKAGWTLSVTRADQKRIYPVYAYE